MKIHMLLSNSFDPDVRVYKEAYELCKHGFDVTIHCWDRTCSHKQTEEIDGIHIVRYQIASKLGSGLKQLPAYYKFYQAVKQYLKHEEHCILHCHDFDTMLIGLCLKHTYRVFDIHENYNYKINGIKGFIYNLLFKKCVNNASKIVYVSQQQKNKIPFSLNEKDCIFLPNYPRLKDYEPIKKTKSDKVRINYVGVVRDTKSLQTLLHYTKRNCTIGIYGDGIALDLLKEYNKQYQAYLHGKFNGVIESAEIYRNTDIIYCVYDPQNYNWKNAYFVKFYEAIITQTPILVTKDTLVGDFVEKHHIGAVVTYGNDTDLDKAITYIQVNYEEIVNKMASISHLFLWDNVVLKLIQSYKEI